HVVGRRTLDACVGGEAVLGLGDAYRELAVAHGLKGGELIAHRFVGGHVLCAINFPRNGADFFQQGHFIGIEQLELAPAGIDGAHTAFATSAAPSPPMAQWSAMRASTPCDAQAFLTSSISAEVSAENRLMEITGTRPNFCTFSTWRARFERPDSSAARFSLLRSSFFTPPCIFSARMVATSTTQSGASPVLRHLMSINFSPPRSAPKPASVTT